MCRKLHSAWKSASIVSYVDASRWTYIMCCTWACVTVCVYVYLFVCATMLFNETNRRSKYLEKFNGIWLTVFDDHHAGYKTNTHKFTHYHDAQNETLYYLHNGRIVMNCSHFALIGVQRQVVAIDLLETFINVRLNLFTISNSMIDYFGLG